jgi:hypothetical protein
MAREYVISSGGITLANQAVTLVFINPASPGPTIEILRCWIGQSANATSAQQRVQLVTQVTAFPTLTSFTPKKTKINDPVSGIAGGTAGAAGTCGINASAEGAGAKTIIHEDAFNVLNGWLWVPTPAETIMVNALTAAGFGLHLPVAAATLTNWAFGVVYRELG